MSVLSLPHFHCSLRASTFVLRNCSVSEGQFERNQHNTPCQSQTWSCLALTPFSRDIPQAGGLLGPQTPAPIPHPGSLRLKNYGWSVFLLYFSSPFITLISSSTSSHPLPAPIITTVVSVCEFFLFLKNFCSISPPPELSACSLSMSLSLFSLLVQFVH